MPFWIALRHMVAVTVINQWFFCSQISQGMVKIKVATMKRHNVQNGGVQKTKFQNSWYFFLVFHTLNAFIPFISTNFKLKEYFQ